MSEMLTTGEACAYLGISYPTFIRMVDSYRIPRYYSGVDMRKRLYRISDLEAAKTAVVITGENYEQVTH